MDLTNQFLNLVAPPFSFFTLMLFLPPFQFFKFSLSILSFLFSENVAGKVVVITGASTGIGEHLADEYARRGACLALAARRENRLREVASLASELGSPDVIIIRADVAKADDCRRIIDETMNHFRQLDHLVNNAGTVFRCKMILVEARMQLEIEDDKFISFFGLSLQDINFWGSVYATRYATPHLRNSKGRVIVISSSTSWMPMPRMSFYNASKAAMTAFFETMRIEFGSDIKITLVSPGFIESELTQGKFLQKEGKLEFDQVMRDLSFLVQVSVVPIARTESCAKAIVNRACQGERYVTELAWLRVTHWRKLFCPEVIEWIFRMLYLTRPGDSHTEAVSKKILDYTGAKNILDPETLQSTELKTD
ncbi:11-beta-hydroxysteroid dehydrogenase A-like [Cornus florida]|uniref:11-beta-hydroxysteroid dehydrogenase A-like n=1 Tax=Cornus florida TaxID=4283 RepID=UPI00289C86C5|nr:11-beta-hydroxysteroid dehydrogenase A-like [Cornus florida]